MSQEDVYELKVPIDESTNHLLKWMAWAKNEPEDIDKKLERIRKEHICAPRTLIILTTLYI